MYMDRLDLELYKGSDNTITVDIKNDDRSDVSFQGELIAVVKRTYAGCEMARFTVSFDDVDDKITLFMPAEETMKLDFVRKTAPYDMFVYDLLYIHEDAVDLVCYGKVKVQAGVTYEKDRL